MEARDEEYWCGINEWWTTAVLGTATRMFILLMHMYAWCSELNVYVMYLPTLLLSKPASVLRFGAVKKTTGSTSLYGLNVDPFPEA